MYDFIAIDFETATIDMNSACSIGIACVDNFEIVDKKYYLIQPPKNQYLAVNTQVHGLTAEDTKDAPAFDAVWNEIKELFSDDVIVVAHNARFDMSVLKACMDTYSIPAIDFKYIDSIAVSNHEISDKNVPKTLEARAAYLGIPLEQHHNALCDAVTCAQIVIACVKMTNRKSLHTYCNSYRRRTSHLFSELKPMKSFSSGSAFKNTSSFTHLEPAAPVTDTSSIFYNKSVVITGEFASMSRAQIAQKVVDLGGIIKSSVSSRTNILISGVQDPAVLSGSDGLSTKERKALDLIATGKDIQILHEPEFLDLIK